MSCKTWTCSSFNSLILLCWINKEVYAWKYCKTSSVGYQTTQGLNICNWLDKLQNSFQPIHLDSYSWWPLTAEGKTAADQEWTAYSKPGTIWKDLTFPKHTEHVWVLLPFKPSPLGQLQRNLSRLSFFLAMLQYLKLHASHYNFVHHFCCSSLHASISYFEGHKDKSR